MPPTKKNAYAALQTAKNYDLYRNYSKTLPIFQKTLGRQKRRLGPLAGRDARNKWIDTRNILSENLSDKTTVMKRIKYLVCALVAAFALTACESTPQETPEQMAIKSVYALDAKICNNSRSAAEVVAKLQSIRLTGCPAPFADAYAENIKAWEKMAAVEKKMYDSNMQKATDDMEKFMKGYSDDPNKSIVELKKQWPAMSAEIDAANAAIQKAYAAFTSAGARYDVVYKKDSSLF